MVVRLTSKFLWLVLGQEHVVGAEPRPIKQVELYTRLFYQVLNREPTALHLFRKLPRMN